MFGQTNSATIKNIDLLNANVHGNASVGSIVGKAVNGSVTNCRVNATVTGTGSSAGMIGETSKTLVKACYNSGTVTGGNYAGGLIGNMSGSTMSSCGFEGTVSGTSAGLIVGNLASSTVIQDCFGYSSSKDSVKGVGTKAGKIVTCIYRNATTGYYIGTPSSFTNWVYDKEGSKKFLPGGLTWLGSSGAGNAASNLSSYTQVTQ